jgi:hypothetical protein
MKKSPTFRPGFLSYSANENSHFNIKNRTGLPRLFAGVPDYPDHETTGTLPPGEIRRSTGTLALTDVIPPAIFTHQNYINHSCKPP